MSDEHLVELVKAFAFGFKFGAVAVGAPIIMLALGLTIASRRAR